MQQVLTREGIAEVIHRCVAELSVAANNLHLGMDALAGLKRNQHGHVRIEILASSS
jgi:hypothetical protein